MSSLREAPILTILSGLHMEKHRWIQSSTSAQKVVWDPAYEQPFLVCLDVIQKNGCFSHQIKWKTQAWVEKNEPYPSSFSSPRKKYWMVCFLIVLSFSAFFIVFSLTIISYTFILDTFLHFLILLLYLFAFLLPYFYYVTTNNFKFNNFSLPSLSCKYPSSFLFLPYWWYNWYFWFLKLH
jgi:hypothetical protein